MRRLFDRLSGPYASVVFSRLQCETQADVAWVRPRAGEKVLDLACGPGTLALELVRYGCCVYAVDLAEQMIARAQAARQRRRCPPVHFAVADVEQLPLPADSFDLVACGFSFADFPEPAQAVAEICRVTRRGGRVAVLEAVAPEDPAQSAEVNRLERLRSGGVPAHLLSLTELTPLFRQAALELLDATVSERKRRLEDWLGTAVGEGGVTTQRRLRRHLRGQFLGTARSNATGMHLERHGGHWFFSAKVARLLWRKP